MGVLYLTTKVGKLKLSCAILAGVLAGMSTYAHVESPSNWNKFGHRGYLYCMSQRLADKLSGDKDGTFCAPPFMEQLLVGTSILSLLVTVISLLIYCWLDDDYVKTKLKPLDTKFHVVACIFLALGVICYGGSAAMINFKCDDDYPGSGGNLEVDYCNYIYRVPEKYLAFAMGIPVTPLYLYTAVVIRRQDSHVVKEV